MKSNLLEDIFRMKTIMGLKSKLIFEAQTEVKPICSPEDKVEFDKKTQEIQKILQDAIKWWENWLSNPTTKEKFTKNYPQEKNVNSVFNQYFNILKQVKLITYDQKCNVIDKGDNYVAFVREDGTNSVYFNINESKEYEKDLSVMTHEIQHLLWFYYPLNPKEKLSSAFIQKNNNNNVISSYQGLSKTGGKTKSTPKQKPQKANPLIEIQLQLGISPFAAKILTEMIKEGLSSIDEKKNLTIC